MVEEKTYDVAAQEFNLAVNVYPTLKKSVYTHHLVRRPTFEEEDRRERQMPLITKEAGKVENADASQTELDEVPANVSLYDKIIKRVFGYSKARGEKAPEEGLAPDDLVQGVDEEGQPKEMKAVDSIPDNHKSLVVNGLFPSGGFEIEETELESFSLGGGREWNIIQKIGGQSKQEDGTLGPPDFIVKYTFVEPSAADLKKFRTSAFAAVSWRDASGIMKDRRTVVLSVISGLFDKLLREVEGLSVNGEKFDPRDKDHLAKIPGAFKKGAMLKLFIFLQADLSTLESK